MFHKEGGKIILIATTLTVVLLLASDRLIELMWLKKTIQILVLFLLIMILQFFRNPKRIVDINDHHIIAPVDGKVVVIEEVFEEEKINLSYYALIIFIIVGVYIIFRDNNNTIKQTNSENRIKGSIKTLEADMLINTANEEKDLLVAENLYKLALSKLPEERHWQVYVNLGHTYLDHKEYKKADADGLAGKFKIVGQVTIGLIVGATLYFNQFVWVEREVYTSKEDLIKKDSQSRVAERYLGDTIKYIDGVPHKFVRVKIPITTIPFVKNHEFNYLFQSK